MAESSSTRERVVLASALELRPIKTADGRKLGHVFDLRCRMGASPAAAPRIEAIAFGRRGWLQRIGLKPLQPGSIEWQHVQTMNDHEIVVATSKR